TRVSTEQSRQHHGVHAPAPPNPCLGWRSRRRGRHRASLLKEPACPALGRSPVTTSETGSRQGDVILRTEHEPIVYFDGIETWGAFPDIGHLTLTATCQVSSGATTNTALKTTAHVRFPLALLPTLKEAIAMIELSAAKSAGDTPF